MSSDKARDHSIIVGGSSGIGRELVLHLAQTDNVSVMARRGGKLSELSKFNDNIFALTSDVSSTDSIRDSLQASVEHFGKVDKLIYCAGKQVVKAHRMAEITDFDSLYDVNLRGALFTSKLFCSSKISEKNARLNGIFDGISFFVNKFWRHDDEEYINFGWCFVHGSCGTGRCSRR